MFNINLMDISTFSVPDQVKITILIISGDGHPDPKNLNNDQDMTDIGLNDENYIQLTVRLNAIIHAQNSAADPIATADVEAAAKVQDVIDLVTQDIAGQ